MSEQIVNNFQWCDPNKEIADPSDLTKYVNLKVRIPNRYADAELKMYESINYGDYYHNENNVHSTSYVDISFTDISNGAMKNRELFGVTNIDISFDAYLIPQVTIDFVDVRGYGLMGPMMNKLDASKKVPELLKKLENQSLTDEEREKIKKEISIAESTVFFESLFAFPYPIFTLTVKGYYGQCVEFDLHLVDFKTRLDSNSGDYKIQTKFIGYMYGCLADTPASYILLSPYFGNVSFGEIIKNKKNIPTVLQFLERYDSLNINDDIEPDDKKNIEIYKKLNNSIKECNEVLSILTDYENHLNGDVNNSSYKKIICYSDNKMKNITQVYLSNDKFVGYALYMENLRFILNAHTTSGAYSFIADKGIKEKIEDICNKIDDYYDEKKKYIFTEENGGELHCNGKKIGDFNIDSGKYKSDSKYNGYFEADKSVVKTNTVFNPSSIISIPTTTGSEFVLFVHPSVLKENIESVKSEIVKKLENKNKDIKDSIVNLMTKKLGFKPTIGNVYEMLFKHLECFNESFRMCISGVKDQNNRKTINNDNVKTDFCGGNNDNLPPFTSFAVMEGGEYKLKYPTEVGYNLKETEYVDKIVSEIVIAKENSDNKIAIEKKMSNQYRDTDFIPTLPSDFLVKRNPYSLLKYEIKDYDMNRELIGLLTLRLRNNILCGTMDNETFLKCEIENIKKSGIDDIHTNTITKQTIIDMFNSIIVNNSEIKKYKRIGNTRSNNIFEAFLYPKNYKDFKIKLSNIDKEDEDTNLIYTEKNKKIFFNISDKKEDIDDFDTFYGISEIKEHAKWSQLNDYDKKIIEIGYKPANVKVTRGSYTSNNEKVNLFYSRDKKFFKDDYDDYEKYYLLSLIELNSYEMVWQEENKKSTTNFYELFNDKKTEKWFNKTDKDNRLSPNFININEKSSNWHTNLFAVLKIGANAWFNFEFNENKRKKIIGESESPFENAKGLGNIDGVLKRIFNAWIENNYKDVFFFNAKNKHFYQPFIDIFMTWASAKNVKIKDGIIDIGNNIRVRPFTEYFRFNDKGGIEYKYKEEYHKTSYGLDPFKKEVIVTILNSADDNTINENKKEFDEKTINKIGNYKNDKGISSADIFKASEEQQEKNKQIRKSVYYTLKNYYDKWFVGKYQYLSNNYVNDSRKEFQKLKIYNGFMKDISQEIYVDVDKLAIRLRNIIENENESFLSLIAGIAEDNECLFITLPIDTYNKSDDIFKPLPWGNSFNGGAGSTNCYVVLKPNKPSTILLEDKSIGYYGDGMNMDDREAFNNADTRGFRVRFGDQNQSIFKSININMDTPVETSESIENLIMISNIGKSGAVSSLTPIKRSLFPIYNARSYSCSIEMMGNMAISPLMYFNLENVPMFNGVYMITNVTHKISASDFVTTFNGTKISKETLDNDYIPFDYDNLINLVDTSGGDDSTTENINQNFNLRDFIEKVINIIKDKDKNDNVTMPKDNESCVVYSESVIKYGQKLKQGEKEIGIKDGVREVFEALYYIVKKLNEVGENIVIVITDTVRECDKNNPSGHCKGEAIDIQGFRNGDMDKITTLKLFIILAVLFKQGNIYQLIWENNEKDMGNVEYPRMVHFHVKENREVKNILRGYVDESKNTDTKDGRKSSIYENILSLLDIKTT